MASRNEIEVIFRGVDMISKEVTEMNRKFSAMNALAVRLAAAFAAAFSVRQVVAIADSMKLLENRLRLVATSSENLRNIQQRLFEAAQATRNSYSGTVDLYTRVARNAATLGLSQERILGVTTAVNQAIQISGASASESAAGLLQLGQALGSGTLRGDELRSILEQLPRLAEAIAEGMGITVGKLRELGSEGKLTSIAVIEAIENQAKVLNTEFGSMEVTVGQSITNLTNSFSVFIAKLDEATGASSLLSQAILAISGAITDLTTLDSEEAIARLIEVETGIANFERSITNLSGTARLGAEATLAKLREEEEALLRVVSKENVLAAIKVVEDQIAAAERNIASSSRRITEGAADIGVRRLEALRRQLQGLVEVTQPEQGPAVFDRRIGNAEPFNFGLLESPKDALASFNEASRILNEMLAESASLAGRYSVEGEGPILPTALGLDELIEAGPLVRQMLGVGVVKPIEEAETAAERLKDALTIIQDQALRNIQSAFADFLFDPFQDGLRGMVRGFADALRRMVAEALAARLIDKIFGGLSVGKEGGGGGFFSKILGSLVGAGKATGGFTTPGMIHPINEREPEFLVSSDRSQVVPLSKMSNNVGIMGRGTGPVYAPKTEVHVTSTISPFELESMLEARDARTIAKFKQFLENGGLR